MSGYTLSAPGNSSASTKDFVAEELSPIQSPGAATQFENSGLNATCRLIDRRLAEHFRASVILWHRGAGAGSALTGRAILGDEIPGYML